MLHNSRYEVDEFLMADANERHNGFAKTAQELMDNIKTMDNIDLLKLYADYTVRFNPFDDDSIESYKVITGEILSRMEGKDNI